MEMETPDWGVEKFMVVKISVTSLGGTVEM